MIVKFRDWKIINNEEFMILTMSIKDGEYIFEKYKKNRTNDQNRYLRWCVYKTIVQSMWKDEDVDEDYIHWIMWMKFLVDKSKKAEYVKSTANLSTQEFMEYIENIKNFVAKYWIIIPEAEDFKWYHSV